MRESWVLSGIRFQLGKAPSPLARCSRHLLLRRSSTSGHMAYAPLGEME
jgi:hypothetical protein